MSKTKDMLGKILPRTESFRSPQEHTETQEKQEKQARYLQMKMTT